MSNKQNIWIISSLLFFHIFLKHGLSSPTEKAGKIDSTLLNRERIAEAVFMGAATVKIDGLLDDAIWQNTPAATDFVQYEPDEGFSATEKTTVRLVYDKHALYVALRAHDSRPAEIKGDLTRRDVESPSDLLGVAIDSYFDRRTAFLFVVNPVGVRTDYLLFNDNDEDPNWNAVWEAATSVDSNGWSAEFRIPFSQLRFQNNAEHVWGFQAFRHLQRLQELSYWRHIPRTTSAMVSRFGQLIGIKDIPAPKRLEILPYTVSSYRRYASEAGDPFHDGSDFELSAGADLKYGITSNLTLDLTLNPDFGQVEADPSEFNLTAYESFFEEKRPFFIEGSNIYSYRISLGDNSDDMESLFYSRRIGRTPQYEPDIPDNFFYRMPGVSTILGAGKLSGKTANGWSIGLLNAVTEEETATISDGEKESKTIVEPLTNYLVARLQKDFRQGKTTFGGIVTNTARDIPNDNFRDLNKIASAGGLDLVHRWHKDEYILRVKAFGSHISGDPAAITRAQKSSARYFQRPDARHVLMDTTRKSLSGHGANFFLGKVAGRHWLGGIGGFSRSPGLECNDLGFLQEVDYWGNYLWLGFQETKPGRLFRNYRINSNCWHSRTFGNENTGIGWNVGFRCRFLNYWALTIGLNGQSSGVSTTALRGGPSIKRPNEIITWLGMTSDERKILALEFFTIFRRDNENSWRLMLNPALTFRPLTQLNMTMELIYNPVNDYRQFVTLPDQDSGDAPYLFGKTDRKTFILITRLNYTLTPDLSIQLYAQPFIAAGKYADYRQVTNPMADSYADRFSPFNYPDNNDFNYKAFHSNLVLRWEYHRGSTLFFVWSQSRSQYIEEMGDFNAAQDLKHLFQTRPENVFLIKINRWLNI